MENQYLKLKSKLNKSYPNYNIDFLLDLVQRENGFLMTFPQNFERALRAVKKEKECEKQNELHRT